VTQTFAPADMTAQAVPTKFHDVVVIKKKTYAKARVLGVPPEECGIERQARSIRDCGYFFHRVVRRQSDLIDEGFDEDDVRSLPTYVTQTGVEELARDTVFENTGTGGDKGINVANRFVRIIEHYVRMDYEGNGKTKLYSVVTGGEIGQVLRKKGKMEIIPEDDIPFASMTPVPVTHRFFGRSIADLVMDIQRIKTALLRGLLDNTYLAVNQRPEVAENLAGESTLDDLLVSRPGAPIRTKGPGCVTWQQLPFIGNEVLPIIQYQDETREWRSGVSRQAQGPQADALQNTPATTAQLMYTAAQSKMKLIARIFAETGIRDMFSLLHETIRKHSNEASVVRLKNQWVNVDPRDWKRREDMTISVGLGPGSKELQMAGMQLIAGYQEKAIAAGLVSRKNLYKSASELTKLVGHKSPDDFFVDPSKPPNPQDPASAPIPPPPDPRAAGEQQKAQLEQQKAQHSAILDQQKMQADLQHQQAKNAAEAALEEKKFQLEAEMKRIDAQLKIQTAERQHQYKLAELAAQSHAHAQNAAVDTEKAHATAPKDHLTPLLAELMDHLRKASAPKRIVRDENGRVSHVEPVH